MSEEQQKPKTSDRATDGRFYSHGREVFKAPKETRREGGGSFSLGFKVLEVWEFLSDAEGFASRLADTLNAEIDAGRLS